MIDRRQLMLAAGSAALADVAAAAAPKMAAAKSYNNYKFPKGFLWGAATAAYQIEGGYRADGKGESIWDRFVLAPGKIVNGDTGNVACDSYNRLDEDLAIIKALGLQSYRFSIGWTRIQADGTGKANEKGLDYYRRLVDGLLAIGVRPLPTLYHWDLPQDLEDRGGWPVRQTADRFADYAEIMAKALGDRVSTWAIFNEPRAFCALGYHIGMHAPGRRSIDAYLRAMHTVNLAQGKAMRAMKAARPALKIGSALDASLPEPVTNSPEDAAACERLHRFSNLWFLTPALTGAYPKVLPAEREAELVGWRDGDDKLMRAPFDWLGINNYSYLPTKHDPSEKPDDVPGLYASADWASGNGDKTDFNWLVYPEGIYKILRKMHETSGNIPIEITESGASYKDGPGPDGTVRDSRRIAYLRSYIGQVGRAIDEGVPVRGYHAWSLLDNFEWAAGYAQRFGIVHVDFATSKRTIKNSGRWYADVIRGNRLV